MPYRISHKDLSTEADDVLHRDPATEQCNLDDTQNDKAVDDLTAVSLTARGMVGLCGHCFPEGLLD